MKNNYNVSYEGNLLTTKNIYKFTFDFENKTYNLIAVKGDKECVTFNYDEDVSFIDDDILDEIEEVATEMYTDIYDFTTDIEINLIQTDCFYTEDDIFDFNNKFNKGLLDEIYKNHISRLDAINLIKSDIKNISLAVKDVNDILEME